MQNDEEGEDSSEKEDVKEGATREDGQQDCMYVCIRERRFRSGYLLRGYGVFSMLRLHVYLLVGA